MDEGNSGKGLDVSFGTLFAKHYQNFPKDDKKKIFDFANHLVSQGFANLPGRNKSSTNVDTDDHKFLEKVRFARDNNLYHYHIGIRNYDDSRSFGDWTSEYILHYAHFGNNVKIIDMSNHPPFSLPSEDYLK